MATLKLVGTLRTDADAHLWTGAISRASRLMGAGDLHDKTALVESMAASLEAYFVPATPGAALRCVDGRTARGYDPADPPKALGPQVQGGSVDETVCQRLNDGTKGATTLAADVKVFCRLHKSAYLPGGHDTDHTIPGKTGCGAIDGLRAKAGLYGDIEAAGRIKDTTTAILQAAGRQPVAGAFERRQNTAINLMHAYEAYFTDGPATLDSVREANPAGVETLPGAHAELTVTLNFVPGTTFNRDGYNVQSDGTVQNFNLDVWNILAEHEPEIAEAIIADAVATLMTLTDGTLLLYMRS